MLLLVLHGLYIPLIEFERSFGSFDLCHGKASSLVSSLLLGLSELGEFLFLDVSGNFSGLVLES